jgi:hypothetical protein
MAKGKNISDFKDCPNCGSTHGYYQKMYASGWINDYHLFEDGSPYNYEMYDHLKWSREGKWYHCIQCDAKLCKVGSDG